MFGEGEDARQFEGLIVECAWEEQEGVWRFMRVRSDKQTPNAYHVYEKVMQSIHDNITEEDLQAEIKASHISSDEIFGCSNTIYVAVSSSGGPES